MARFIDARIPVVFGSHAGPGDVLLAADRGWQDVHAAGCTCCAARGPVELALDRLFVARAKGHVPWFGRVVADRADEAAIRDALAADPLTLARFRLVAAC